MTLGDALLKLAAYIGLALVAKAVFFTALFGLWLAVETHRGHGLCDFSFYTCEARQ